jgi:Hemocyanin, ig-like domain
VDVEVPTEYSKYGKFGQYKGKDFYIGAFQQRLNHLPFNFTLNVFSEFAQKAVVYMYIGPKYDNFGKPYSYESNRFNWFQLEQFYVDLNKGENFIFRESRDFSWFVADRTTYFELYKSLMLALKGEKKFEFGMSEAHCGFPARLMLPKGTYEGFPYQFFYMVMPYMPPTASKFSTYDYKYSCGIGSGSRYLDNLPFGFPFDRTFSPLWRPTPNMYFYDTKIYHKY